MQTGTGPDSNVGTCRKSCKTCTPCVEGDLGCINRNRKGGGFLEYSRCVLGGARTVYGVLCTATLGVHCCGSGVASSVRAEPEGASRWAGEWCTTGAEYCTRLVSSRATIELVHEMYGEATPCM